MRYLIGIDDTDNLTGGGTGKLARQLRKEIAEHNLAQTIGITRHQLHLSPEIPYTSHNSSACIMVETSQELVNALSDYCREYLLLHSEEGSDVGLCIAAWEWISSTVQAFGQQAKEIVLTQEQAVGVATVSGIFLEGLTGTKQGIIGALAAVGLRKNGNDGRFIWVPGLYDLSGVHTASELYQIASIDRIQDLAGELVGVSTRINTSPWPRPVLIDGQAVMLVVKAVGNQLEITEDYEYEMAPKNIIRRY